MLSIWKMLVRELLNEINVLLGRFKTQQYDIKNTSTWSLGSQEFFTPKFLPFCNPFDQHEVLRK